MRLPRRILLPFGYAVLVREVTDAEMLAEQEVDDKEAMADGLWDVEERTICVRRALPVRRKRYILGHELGHAFIDWQHHCLDLEAMRP